MEWFQGFKERFNLLTNRRIKAEGFMENPSTTQEQIEKWLPEYYKIIRELSLMMAEYEEKTGRKICDRELFEGFN